MTNVNRKIICTSLVDAKATAGCRPEFGLALLLEAYGKRILFDTGQNEALQHNATALGIDLDNLDGIVLSHGHYDHTGGLANLAPKCPIFAISGITAPCFSRHDDGTQHWISMPEKSKRVLENSDMRAINGFTEIFSGIFLTGTIARNSDEDSGGHFFTDADCSTTHIVPEEQGILLKDGILITGCCHAGIINTIETCRTNRPDIDIHTIIGGLHLLHATAERLGKTTEYLATLQLKEMLLMHCTGEEAGKYLNSHLDCRIRWSMAGQKDLL